MVTPVTVQNQRLRASCCESQRALCPTSVGARQVVPPERDQKGI